MADKPVGETTKNNDTRFKKGNKIGNRFSSTNQPSPEAKREGWLKRNELQEELTKRVGKKLDYIFENASPKELIDLIKALLPPDKQVNDINFKNINPDVIVETIEMRKKSESYTKKLLDD